MFLNRREFVAGSVANLLAVTPEIPASTGTGIKAIAFDAFPIFDPRSVFTLAGDLFPGRGSELSSVWRTKQFEYTWLRTVSHRYEDFWKVTEDALVFAARSLDLALTSQQQMQLMQSYLELKPWPDALPTLQSLKEKGLRLAFLSNFTPRMLDAAVKNAKLEGLFEHILSTDKVRTYKPAPQAYQMALQAFRLRRDEILFVPFAGWDAAGAKGFGYPTFWVNRLNAPAEELGVVPDASGKTLTDLVHFVR